MQRFLEFILGLPKGFLSREGHFSLQFNPSWPFQDYLGGPGLWNLLLVVAGLLLVVYVYRREGRSRRAKIVLGTIRALLIALVIFLLNRPMLTLGQIRREPSVLAILFDDSASMKVRDAAAPGGQSQTRLDWAVHLLSDNNAQLLRKLSSVHTIHLYDFSQARREFASVDGPSTSENSAPPSVDQAIDALSELRPDGQATQIVPAIRSVLEDLQGQRLAGVVVLTDGKETPTQSLPDAVAAIKSFGADIYPVAIGSEHVPQNIAIDAVSYEPSAFVDDITNLKVTVHATGYEPNHPITLVLQREITKDGHATTMPVTDETGREISKIVTAPDDKPFDVDLQFKPNPSDMPNVNLIVEAKPQDGEFDDQDNFRKVQLAVLDNNIAVLYVDGYPRWDYRYIKNSMLRDKTIKISCLLTSADPSFRQEGSDDPNHPGKTWAITVFPATMDQLLDYDVVMLGDVDPRQFTDAQLQLISDFVSKKGGGFEMIAGPRFSPQDYRNTPVEPLLPVIVTHVQADDSRSAITEGFRPVLTAAGAQSSIFRFFPDRAVNDEYIKNHLQELFWYCRGVMVKPGAGIVFAEHPNDLGPDNRKAPLLVAGRFGAGRTLFSAFDDSWRWRYYTGESIFNTYWVQQLRYLARGRKLGQRKLTFARDQDVYELGKQVTLQLRILSPDLIQQLSTPITVEVTDDATGQSVRRVDLNRQEAADVFVGTFTADKLGQFSVKLPGSLGQDLSLSYRVETPQLELDDPKVDVPFLSRIATIAPISPASAADTLAKIPSAAKVIPIDTDQPLWNAPLALIVFAGLITVEWIARKTLGLL
jgi:uncharacterized membrane protein